MKQALAWAYSHGEIVFVGGGMKAIDGMNAWARALRQAIERAEKQEPVAYINVEQRKLEWAKYTKWDTPTVVNLPKIPLYTTPQPQREWVGLTPDEVFSIADQHPVEGFDPDIMAYTRAIEAKLKEKNT